MEMRKCPNGHYYDASMYSECPYCDNMTSGGATMPLEGMTLAGSSDGLKTMPLAGSGMTGATMPLDSGKTMALGQAFSKADPDEGRTVALIKEEKGIDPVVGWFVCIEGSEKGRDYRIHSDNNHIGRSDSMDICIRGDETISRENHATVSFDSMDGTFYFSPGEGRAIARMNGKAIFQTQELKPYDRVTIGKTELVFIPLCGESFHW